LAIREGMADVRYRLGEYVAAWEEYDRARALAEGDPDAGVRVAGILRRMAKCLAEQGQYDQALALQAEAEGELQGNEEAAAVLERSRILLDSGWAHYSAGHYAETVRCAQQAQALAEPIGAARELGDGFNLLGLVAKATGKYGEAIRHHCRTLELARQSEDVPGIGIALNNLGNVHCEQGRLAEAEACYGQAAQIWERMGDVVQKAQTLNNLGSIFLARGEFARAEEQFRAAHHLFRRANHPLGIAASLGTLGELYLEEGRLAEAARSLEEALSLVEAASLPEYAAYLHAVLAQTCLEQGRLDEADRCCCAVLEAAEAPDQALNEAYTGRARRVRGLVLSARGRHPEALAELERARQIFRAADQAQELGRTCIALAAVQRELRDEAEAATLLRTAIELFEQAGAQADLEKARAIASC
jgi:tetratricopeptide (TPR) repeat protein